MHSIQVKKSLGLVKQSPRRVVNVMGKFSCSQTFQFLSALCLAVLAGGDDTLEILIQPQLGYARQSLVVQPVIRVTADAQTIQAIPFPANTSLGFFGNNIVIVQYGLANFTDLGFQNEGVYSLSFSADGLGETISNPIVVQVRKRRKSVGSLMISYRLFCHSAERTAKHRRTLPRCASRLLVPNSPLASDRPSQRGQRDHAPLPPPRTSPPAGHRRDWRGPLRPLRPELLLPPARLLPAPRLLRLRRPVVRAVPGAQRERRHRVGRAEHRPRRRLPPGLLRQRAGPARQCYF